jgi:hypothetical protein
MESMMTDMRITEYAHQLIQRYAYRGSIVIDATAGNGHDALFLSQCVGPLGFVYACDIQSSALLETRKRIRENYETCAAACLGERPAKMIYVEDSHANVVGHLRDDHRGRISCAVFNLGYLPGGDKSLTTISSTTIAAIEAIWNELTSPACISVLAYTGHPGGIDECNQVEAFMSKLAELDTVELSKYPIVPADKSPIHFFLEVKS